jgi:hypothetical protein
MPTFYAPLDLLIDACRVLRDAPELRFVFLADVTAVTIIRTRGTSSSTFWCARCGGLRRHTQAAAPQGARARGDARAVGLERLAVGQLGRARSVRFLRPALRRASRYAPDPDARRLGRVSDAQGLPGPDQSTGKDVRTPSGVGGRVRGDWRRRGKGHGRTDAVERYRRRGDCERTPDGLPPTARAARSDGGGHGGLDHPSAL